MKAIGSKVIFKRLEDATTTKAGLILPSSGVKRHCRGLVVSAPDTIFEGSTEIKSPIKVGDVIVAISKMIEPLENEQLYWVHMSSIVYVEE